MNTLIASRTVAPWAVGQVRSGSSGATAPKEEIIENILAKNMFSEEKVKAVVDEYFQLGFHASYLASYTPELLADHVYGYLCAKAESISGNTFHHHTTRDDIAFFFCSDGHRCQQETMRMIESYILANKERMATHSISVRSYHGSNQDGLTTVLFTVGLSKFRFPNPTEEIKNNGFSLEAVSTDTFLEQRSEEAKKGYASILTEMAESFTSAYNVVETDGEQMLCMAFKADRPAYFAALSSLINEIPGAKITKKFMESFSNGVQTYSFYCLGATKAQLEEKANLIMQLPHRPHNAITGMMADKILTGEQTVFANCLMIYAFYFTPPPESEDYRRLKAMVENEAIGVTRLNSFRQSLNQEIMSESHLGDVMAAYPDLFKSIYADFKAGSTVESRAVIEKQVLQMFEKDPMMKNIFLSFLRFNGAVVKHNFFKPKKAALSFRLDPKLFMSELDFPRIPHGIFLLIGPQWRGFHIRFTDIARGGVRLILSDPKTYKNNKITVFQENYNLALTQLLKNKDIPEGGSKGTLLVSTRTLGYLDDHDKTSMFRQYVDAMQDTILPNQEGVVDNLKEKEIIFLGPDENTAGAYPKIAALHAKGRGYEQWKSFTTGKDPSLGGIPHDAYAMTTRSVRKYVEGIYEKLGLDETTLTKLQTGGPDGDLGSNEILRSKEILHAVVDGAGVLYDPKGIDRTELNRLATDRHTCDHFDIKKLSKDGFFVLADKEADSTGKSVTLPDGTKVTKSVDFRNNFHFSKYIHCDVFVPCGGRPRTINLDNVHQMLMNHPTATGEQMLRGMVADVTPDNLRFKIIVEGANLFITHDARLALEKCGVCLIKDASANKGGVTSSSLEVYAGLALTDVEHSELMCGSEDGKTLPKFYQALVKEIIEIVEGNARKEFDLIWKISQENPNIPKTVITDRLSRKIVEIRGFLYDSSMFEDKKFVRYVLDQYTPKTLKEKVDVDTLMTRVPENYQRAICSIWLASHFVYANGIESNEFDFYEFMRSHRAQAV